MTAAYFSRIGTSNAYDRALQNISQRQSGLAELQENLTSGKKILRSSDDPTGAALAERALTRIHRVQADQRALEAQRNSIATAESTLGDVVSQLQEFRELAVQAGNGSYTGEERKIITQKMTSLREHILDLSNRTDSNGMPLFAGLGSATSPFVGPTALPDDYTFKGLPGQTASTVNSIPYALDGDSAFMFNATRDGITSPSIFSSLDTAIRDIANASNSLDASAAVRDVLRDIDVGMNRIMAVRGQAGELLNRADRITDSNSKLNLELEANRSRAEDLDLMKGISDFQNHQTGYQAALQSYAQVKKLSLFDFIR
jgi:flagellin-like hook-associated protein FlgL